MTVQFDFLVELCVITYFTVLAGAVYNGNLGNTESYYAYSVEHATSEFDCYLSANALGEPNWNTACSFTEDVSSCFYKNMDATLGEYCEVRYLCDGWVPDPSDEFPAITVNLPVELTEITQVAIFDKGSRGWLEEISFAAKDGLTYVAYSSVETHYTPSEKYKESPPQQAGGPYFAPGLDYRGGVNVTHSGAACVNWMYQPFLEISALNGLGDHSFCRNPTNDENGPWCYTDFGGIGQEYCDVPFTLGCDDSESIYNFAPIANVWTKMKIKLRKTYGAIAAIDSLKITGKEAKGCIDTNADGHWQPPHCNICKPPFKGVTCTDLTCSGNPCVHGTCNGTECVCYPGYYGSSCDNHCPTSQPEAQIVGPESLNQAQICAGHGTCFDKATGNGTCKCNATYAGAHCQLSCPRNAVTGVICSNNGTCNEGSAGDATCSCTGESYGTDCSLALCGGGTMLPRYLHEREMPLLLRRNQRVLVRNKL